MRMASVRQSAIRRFGIASAGLAFATVSLTGCRFLFTPVPDVDLAVQMDGDFLVVANCGRSVDGVFQVDMSETVSNRWETFFGAETDSGWDHAEELHTNSDAWTNIELSQVPELSPGSKLSVALGSDGTGRWASYTIPERGLPEAGWLHPDGTLTKAACGD